MQIGGPVKEAEFDFETGALVEYVECEFKAVAIRKKITSKIF